MAEVKAPFNFVPAPDKVFYPYWAAQVSHDVPFRGSLDGYLDITVKAETPIFVRNGSSDKDHKEKLFSHVVVDGKNRYFIPGSSMKGSIRSVLEIMSFGKMHIDPKMRFAQREWIGSDIYDMQQMCNPRIVKAGWLRKSSDGNYSIEMARKFYRINQARIDEYLGADIFAKAFGDKSGPGKLEDKYKTAMHKYSLTEGKDIEGLRFEVDEEYTTSRSERVMVSEYGSIHGDLVLTGQPDKWSPRGSEERQKVKGNGKFYEYVFEYEDEDNVEVFDISKTEYEQYKFIYGGNENNDEDLRKQWEFIKDKVNGNGMPVFFRLNNDRETVKDFGFTCMYKLPFTFTPDHFEKKREVEGRFDLAELMFGFIDEKKNTDALKGRVQFSHLFSKDAVECEEDAWILGNPKASYYPIYVRQVDGHLTRYMTYNDDEASLAGWKRYVNRTGTWNKKTGNEELDSIMIPLAEGTTFTGRIVYHNLKQEELGALISALTFHGNDGCFHQIGQGKPYGLGRISISLGNLPDGYQEQMASFEIMMDQGEKDSWRNSKTIKELFAMSRDVVEPENDKFKYMELTMEKDGNEFNAGKKSHLALPYYSKLRPSSVAPLADDGQKVAIESRIVEAIRKSESEIISAFESKLAEGNVEEAEKALCRLEEFCKNNSSMVSMTQAQLEGCRGSIQTKKMQLEAEKLAKLAGGTKKSVEDILANVDEKTKLMTFAENLRKSVKRDGADLMPYRNSILEKIELIVSGMKPRDKKDLKPAKFKDLADALGVTLEDLIKL